MANEIEGIGEILSPQERHMILCDYALDGGESFNIPNELVEILLKKQREKTADAILDKLFHMGYFETKKEIEEVKAGNE